MPWLSTAAMRSASRLLKRILKGADEQHRFAGAHPHARSIQDRVFADSFVAFQHAKSDLFNNLLEAVRWPARHNFARRYDCSVRGFGVSRRTASLSKRFTRPLGSTLTRLASRRVV